MAVVLNVSVERWPIAGAFTISRGSKTEAEVVVAELHDGAVTGRGECTPYGRYGESVEAVVATIAALAACRTDVCNLIGNDGFAGVNVHLTLDRVRSALLRSPSTFNRDVLAPV